jgi:hypothetical protein
MAKIGQTTEIVLHILEIDKSISQITITIENSMFKEII